MIEAIIGNYKFTGIIAKGGMGAVYFGEDLSLKRPVAIKAIRPEIVDKPYVLERFRTEAITTAKLNHPNIATVYGLMQNDNAQFLIMEYVKGWTLSQILHICGTLSPVQAILILKAALAGIGHAHRQGIIHRDLKPTNLMLNENGLVKVMDFGIARVSSGPKFTQTGQLVGTLKYMPPEQIRGDALDARTDIYALGLVLYKLLTGRVPFSARSDYQLMKAQVENEPPPPKTFTDEISEVLQTIVLTAISKNMEDRFASTDHFSAALSQCPEIDAASEKELEKLAERMWRKHPVTIKPLNQQLSDALYRNSSVSLNSSKGGVQKPSAAASVIQRSVSGITHLIERSPQLNWRNFFVISLLVAILGVFIFFLSSQDSTEKNTHITHSIDDVQPTTPINDEESEIRKNGTGPEEPLNQQEQKRWIIER